MLKDDYETDDLPHTIRDDVDVLCCLKKKLDECNVIQELLKQTKEQYQEQLDTRWHYRTCPCSWQIDCECEPYPELQLIPECERSLFGIEIEKLFYKERDLQTKLNH